MGVILQSLQQYRIFEGQSRLTLCYQEVSMKTDTTLYRFKNRTLPMG
ncbi:hypothetical protein SAMN05216570_1331 [Dyella sp. OK004]|nr:hypothetical protein SAMN05216570_1331 [Dyella sp. OK004]